MKLFSVLFFICITLYTVGGDDFEIGDVSNRVIQAKSENVEYNAIPSIKRVKYHFYTQKDNRLIQGIKAVDNLHSQSTINITAGGVGYSYVNLRLKSERGRGLNYDIRIYVLDFFYH